MMLKSMTGKPAQIAFLVRRAIGDSQIKEFSAKSGVSISYLSQLINRRTTTIPTAKMLLRISRSSEGRVSSEELLQAAGYMPTEDEAQESTEPVLQMADRNARSRKEKAMALSIAVLAMGKAGISYEIPEDLFSGDYICIRCEKGGQEFQLKAASFFSGLSDTEDTGSGRERHFITVGPLKEPENTVYYVFVDDEKLYHELIVETPKILFTDVAVALCDPVSLVIHREQHISEHRSGFSLLPEE
ncbi:MAG: helix-turn-helix transcriptional regulator [Lachnospiraceae bacterium]|nr:helix-turn-helix transcriptional regulator [Lachnospiraceae bacterium]